MRSPSFCRLECLCSGGILYCFYSLKSHVVGSLPVILREAHQPRASMFFMKEGNLGCFLPQPHLGSRVT